MKELLDLRRPVKYFSGMLSCLLCNQIALTPMPVSEDGLMYRRCNSCDLIFMDPECRLSREEEHKRYRLHRNDLEDPGYREFLWPIIEAVRENVVKGASGLDYGCGPVTMMTHLLSDEFRISHFDPLFFPDTGVLEQTYDFIICSEVAEHFHSPAEEFRRLRSFLNPAGVLICMTQFHTPQTDFLNWHYRRDPTHVCFYSHKSFEWIGGSCGFQSVKTQGERVAILRRSNS